ncbi:MAG TPA: HesA/MoeB/ThiF family protein [Vulgatibacter sp.]|nr:HesA/MoeB/ThiF family protein [Vulgatibacter sp.]
MGRTKKRALVIGAGGLGCAVLPLLARQGVEAVVLDDDTVSLSNLQRQLLFGTADLGRPKAEVAAERVRALVPGASIDARMERLTPERALELLAGVDVVVDGSDNFPTRFLVNDACVISGTPLVHGAILRFTGQVMAISPRETACYRCLFEAPPPAGVVPSCAEAGVLGALCGIVGAWMVWSALALLSGTETQDGLIVHDALAGSTRLVGLRRDPACAVCGDAPSIRTLTPERYVEAEACVA